MKLKIGQKVIWIGTESKYDQYEWLKKGMIGSVIEYHPGVKGTGRILSYYEDGEPMIDVGIEEWWTIDFGVAGKRAAHVDSIGESIKVAKEEHLK